MAWIKVHQDMHVSHRTQSILSLCAPQAVTVEEEVGTENVAPGGSRQHGVNVVDAQRLALLTPRMSFSPLAMRSAHQYAQKLLVDTLHAA